MGLLELYKTSISEGESGKKSRALLEQEHWFAVNAEFDPKSHAALEIDPNEMNDEERAAAGVSRSVEDIQLDVSTKPGTGVE